LHHTDQLKGYVPSLGHWGIGEMALQCSNAPLPHHLVSELMLESLLSQSLTLKLIRMGEEKFCTLTFNQCVHQKIMECSAQTKPANLTDYLGKGISL